MPRIWDDLTCLMRNLYAGQEVTIRTGHGITDWFQIRKGVCQGCILSPCLFHFGEGDGTPLQYSCLENPMDGGAWCAAIHGVAKTWTRLRDFTFTFHFHALEKEMANGNGNPLQCSCLENPRNRGAWWAAVYGVAQSRTRLKRLSSSSSSQQTSDPHYSSSS